MTKQEEAADSAADVAEKLADEKSADEIKISAQKKADAKEAADSAADVAEKLADKKSADVDKIFAQKQAAASKKAANTTAQDDSKDKARSGIYVPPCTSSHAALQTSPCNLQNAAHFLPLSLISTSAAHSPPDRGLHTFACEL
jgi:hypothetical protein